MMCSTLLELRWFPGEDVPLHEEASRDDLLDVAKITYHPCNHRFTVVTMANKVRLANCTLSGVAIWI